jgi:cell wall-associated NlpC family hydrolase
MIAPEKLEANMKKITALVVGFFMFFSTVGTVFADNYETGVEWGVNFRSAPSTDSYVFRMIPKGEDIHVIDQVNEDWLQVKVQDGTIGFVSAKSKFTDYNGSASNQRVITTGSPWLRSAPSYSDSKIYRSVPEGTQLSVLDKPNKYYVKVNYNGQTGYISTSYIKYTSGSVGSGGSGDSSSQQPAPSGKADAIIQTAKSLIGRAEYDFGTRNHARLILDCSSFTEYVFEKHGIPLKWGTRYQKNAGSYVSKSNLRKGDLVFFSLRGGSSIGHVGIYISNGQFIHIIERGSASDVSINNLNSGYWEDNYITARRVIE